MLSDTAVVARAQDGDIAAFETLVRQHQTGLFRYAVRMTRDRSEAEDIVQDTLVTAWRRLPTLSDADAFQPWLYQVAHRQCLALIRTRTRRGIPTPDLEPAQQQERSTDRGDHVGPARSAELAAQSRDLDALIAQLPVELRACWILNAVNGMSYPVIAQTIGVPLSTVRGRIARARAQLAEGMSQWR